MRYALPLILLAAICGACSYQDVKQPVGTSFEFQQLLELKKRAMQACPQGYEIMGHTYTCLEPSTAEDTSTEQ